MEIRNKSKGLILLKGVIIKCLNRQLVPKLNLGARYETWARGYIMNSLHKYTFLHCFSLIIKFQFVEI